MKAKDAEQLMAELLTSSELSQQAQTVLKSPESVGFLRARPIYQRKLKSNPDGVEVKSCLWVDLLRKLFSRRREMHQHEK